VAAGKKNAARLGAHLVFVDESGFSLIPNVRKTWAEKGHTPTVHHQTWPRHKLSVISAVTLSPKRRRVGLMYAIHTTNIATTQVTLFLHQLLQVIRGPIILVWDGAKTHQSPAVRDVCHRHPRLHLERFPPYAPELNPDEGVWSLAKRDLANGRSQSLEQLRRSVRTALEATRRSRTRLTGCIRATLLKIF
jgi:putative transposase